jgi:hypothetical protein
MLPFVRPILAFLIAPMSTSALLFTIGFLRRSETTYFDPLVIIMEISYISAALLGIPCYLLFRRKNINSYLAYVSWGGVIGGVPPFAILAPCALSSRNCGVVNIGFLTLLALGISFGMLSAIVFRIILGKHNIPM